MIELEDNELVISFPEIHPDARASIKLKRTLRIPDDGQTYPLPPGFDNFELRHIEDYSDKVPHWQKKGGVMMPMYQSEALWLSFHGNYPIAVKIRTGKINVIDGTPWNEDSDITKSTIGWDPRRDSHKQDYIVIPDQPWIDGYCIGEDLIAQFVAMPLGLEATAEEQISGSTEGGMQIQAIPLKANIWEKALARERAMEAQRPRIHYSKGIFAGDMGLSLGGSMKQKIHKDYRHVDDWETSASSRCWIHICNSKNWKEITGEEPPHAPFSADDYIKRNLPWFDYYSKEQGLGGSEKLKSLKTISEFPTNNECFPFNL